MVTVLMMSAKMATPGLFKLKVFWKKGYNVTNKFLLCDLNYIVNVVMRLKLGNSNTFMREVIITSMLWGLSQKNPSFWGVVWVQVQWFETGTTYGLEILNQCLKRVKTKSQKVLWANSYICTSYKRKTGRGPFLAHPSWNRVKGTLMQIWKSAYIFKFI